jgi:hypothetical protein
MQLAPSLLIRVTLTTWFNGYSCCQLSVPESECARIANWNPGHASGPGPEARGSGERSLSRSAGNRPLERPTQSLPETGRLLLQRWRPGQLQQISRPSPGSSAAWLPAGLRLPGRVRVRRRRVRGIGRLRLRVQVQAVQVQRVTVASLTYREHDSSVSPGPARGAARRPGPELCGRGSFPSSLPASLPPVHSLLPSVPQSVAACVPPSVCLSIRSVCSTHSPPTHTHVLSFKLVPLAEQIKIFPACPPHCPQIFFCFLTFNWPSIFYFSLLCSGL